MQATDAMPITVSKHQRKAAAAIGLREIVLLGMLRLDSVCLLPIVAAFRFILFLENPQGHYGPIALYAMCLHHGAWSCPFDALFDPTFRPNGLLIFFSSSLHCLLRTKKFVNSGGHTERPA